MIQVSGKFQIENGYLRIVLHNDICRYYRWLFMKDTYNTIWTQTPRHGAHINIIAPNIHKNLDANKARHLAGKRVTFHLDVEGNFGGFTKGFRNFWLNVVSPELDQIADDLGVPKKQGRFARFHLTIFNTKNTGLSFPKR